MAKNYLSSKGMNYTRVTIQDDTQTSTNDNTTNQLSDDAKATTTNPDNDNTVEENDILTKESKPNKQHGRMGRPYMDPSRGKKTEYCNTVNISIPKETIKQIHALALPGRKVNFTEYINILIENDLKKNAKTYKKEIMRTVNFD